MALNNITNTSSAYCWLTGHRFTKKEIHKKLLITFVNLRLYSHGQQNPDKINVKLKSSPTPKYNSKLNYVDTGLDLHYN